MPESYKIIDEPAPSAISRVAVNPVWIFLASLFGGAGIGLLWFALNAFALSSASRMRELGLVCLGLLGTPLIFATLTGAMNVGWLGPSLVPYLHLVVTGFQLFVIYLLHLSQHKSYELFSLYGGAGRSGLLVVVALAFLRPQLAEALGVWSAFIL
ncbi:MAG TPA: hypothetical protein VI197_26360 [Polyangiaceae bacterium]